MEPKNDDLKVPPPVEDQKEHWNLTTSSMISRFAWVNVHGENLYTKSNPAETDKGVLVVEFPSGMRYHYHNVGRFVAEGMKAAESTGRFFNAMIKGRSEYAPPPVGEPKA